MTTLKNNNKIIWRHTIDIDIVVWNSRDAFLDIIYSTRGVLCMHKYTDNVWQPKKSFWKTTIRKQMTDFLLFRLSKFTDPAFRESVF